jgi:prepilin-type N-terminal cleavage/methylation domain-containing protein
MKYFTKNTKKAFSIIEVIVTIAVFSVGLLSVMVLYSTSLSGISLVRNQVVAGALVQEGVELARNIADSSSGGVSALTAGDQQRIYEYDADGAGGSDPDVFLEDNNDYRLWYVGAIDIKDVGRYIHDDGSGSVGGGDEETRFQRRIIIQDEDIDNDGVADDKRVQSLVVWNGNMVDAHDCTPSNNCTISSIDLIDE